MKRAKIGCCGWCGEGFGVVDIAAARRYDRSGESRCPVAEPDGLTEVAGCKSAQLARVEEVAALVGEQPPKESAGLDGFGAYEVGGNRG